ncbi:cellulase [Chitinophaga silvatica]|uniref:Endoglucanase n=1 Tax=Chitinophaga silvatica TaxID=2282649 RepID=A0A3E1YEK0_9BACT|nr:glycoside hydrolase family 9 protein [Chitinophaga silvatica]RFS24975.1 cellulase [Chitinophaga silvatica]
MSRFLIFCFSIFILLSNNLTAQTDNPIRINQCGYYPFAPKLAVVITSGASDSFYVIKTTRDTVMRGVLGSEQASLNSALHTRLIDFSALTDTGSYKILVPGYTDSYQFNILPDAMQEVAKAVLKGYYYQRASMPLLQQYAGKWARAAGHPDTNVLIHSNAADETRKESFVVASPGGWYDAGDYNKYIVNSGITMGTLLAAYEDYPDYFNKLLINLPESGNGIPDILNEIVYNLRWMLTMQDPNDGGVYHKCTNASFDGMIMPDKAKTTRYLVQKGTAATLDFAAVTAQSARVLKPFLPQLADSCLIASRAAWAWANTNPALPYNQDSINKIYKPAIQTGAYGDNQFYDEWLWAAAELYATTDEQPFLEMFKLYIPKQLRLPNWGNVAAMAYYTILRKEQTSALSLQLKEQLLTLAAHYKNSNTAFHTVMGQSVKDFVWGSNDVAAHQGVLMLFAYKLTGDKTYVNRALDNVDYILGRNATGYSFVTGFGTKSPMHPHHRPSIADKITEPIPGLVVGGPNPKMEDKCKYPFTTPEQAYTDQNASYASNEIAINWNAPLVYLVNAMEAIQKDIVHKR